MDPRYDVFISYRWVEPDMSWVREQLVPALQAAGVKVLLDVEDFVPGRNLILEMTRAGKESRRAICVISPDYCEGNRMAGFESLMAVRSDPSGSESRAIPFIFRQTELPEWMRGLIPVDWTAESRRPGEWKKLLQTLQAPRIDSPAPGTISKAPEIVGTPSRAEFLPKHSWERVNPRIIHQVFWQASAVCLLAILGRIVWASPKVMSFLGLTCQNQHVPYALHRAIWFGLGSLVAGLVVWLGVMDTQFVLSLSKVLLFVSALGLICAGVCCVPAISYWMHRALLAVFIVAGSAYFFLFGMARYYWKLRSYGDVAAEGVVFIIFAYVMWDPVKMLFEG